MLKMTEKKCSSHTVRLWIAGDYATTLAVCRDFTMRGLCVAVQPADYVYTMGVEAGVVVTLINYPRFPVSPEELEATATDLGFYLCNLLHQGSFSIETPNETRWYSRRHDAEEG